MVLDRRIIAILLCIGFSAQAGTVSCKKESVFVARAKEEMVFKLISQNRLKEIKELWPFNLETKGGESDRTPLQYAIATFHDAEGDIDKEMRAEIILWLIDKGAALDLVDKSTGRSLLHEITLLLRSHFYNQNVFRVLFRTFKRLVRKGVDFEVQDKEGKTFLQYLQGNGISTENLEKMLEAEILRQNELQIVRGS